MKKKGLSVLLVLCMLFSLAPAAFAYTEPDNYVIVYKDGRLYQDFMTSSEINQRFGSGSRYSYVNFDSFDGFTYYFANDQFTVYLDNFTGEALYFKCGKKDTGVHIYYKGKNTLSGEVCYYDYTYRLCGIQSTASDGFLYITPTEEGATLNIDLNVENGRFDRTTISSYSPFVAGTTFLTNSGRTCRGAVNVNMKVDISAAEKLSPRYIHLAEGDLYMGNVDLNYTYTPTKAYKYYSAVTGKFRMYSSAVLNAELKNYGSGTEYLFNYIQYWSGFTGGAYFTCTGGKYMDPSKTVDKEIFSESGCFRYLNQINSTQYRAVVSSDYYSGIQKVKDRNIGMEFPSFTLGKKFPAFYTGPDFVASLDWTDENGNSVNGTAVDIGKIYYATATYVPKPGYVLNCRSGVNLTTAKPGAAYSASRVILQNTSTYDYGKLKFQFYRTMAAEPKISTQPFSDHVREGEKVTLYFQAYNVVGYEWHMWYYVSNTPGNIKIRDIILTGNSQYSGADTDRLTFTASKATANNRYYYCKVFSPGYVSRVTDDAHIELFTEVSAAQLTGLPAPAHGSSAVPGGTVTVKGSSTVCGTVAAVKYKMFNKTMDVAESGDNVAVEVQLTANSTCRFQSGIMLYWKEYGETATGTVTSDGTKAYFTFSAKSVPVPANGIPIKSVKETIETPVIGEPFSTGVLQQSTGGLKQLYKHYSVESYQWNSADTRFYANKSYTLIIWLKADADYTFTAETSASINDNAAQLTVSGYGKGNRAKVTYTVVMPPCPGHDWVFINRVIEPTCKSEGADSYRCSLCGVNKSETVPKTNNHTWDAGKVTKAPTCKDTGIKTYTCTVCGKTKTETVAKTTTHTWDAGKVTKAPTCKDTGIKTYTCTVCGKTKTETLSKTNDHKWDGGKVTTAPTTTAEGVRTYTCTVCGKTKTEAIAKLSEPDPFIPGVPYMLGDVNNDGTVGADDARLALRRSVDLEDFAPGSRAFKAADVDASGAVEAMDARRILRASVGLETLG